MPDLSLIFAASNTEISSFPDMGTRWLHASHLGEILDYTTPSRYLPTVLLPSEYREVKQPSGRPALYVRVEAGFKLAMKSKSPFAEEFCHWLAYDVLGSLIKTGEYKATAADQQHFAPFGLTVQIATVEEAQGKNQIALQNAEPGTGQVLTLVKESAALRQEKIALDRLLKATPTKEAVDREQAIENHILERLGRFPEGVTIQHLVVSKFLEKHQARRIKVILPVLQKLRSQGRCEEIAPNTWKLTGDLS